MAYFAAMFHLSLALLAALPLVLAASHCSVPSSWSGSPGAAGSGRIAMSWYAGWHSSDLPPEKISWDKYNVVAYSFAMTTSDVHTLSLDASDAELLPKFVQLAHKNGVKAVLTVGGWTGSQYFSTAVGSEENRTSFVNTVLNMVHAYDLDGLDFDWESPNNKGMGCNTLSPTDSENLLSFLRALRVEPGAEGLILSAAVGITPFSGSDGQPLADVSGFASVLDFVEIMNYDVWGSWSDTVGPNAPLDDTCATGARQQGSAVSALKAWTNAGFPASRLVLGVASYGHGFKVDKSAAFNSAGSLAAYPKFVKSYQPKGDAWDEKAEPGVDQCGIYSHGGFSGLWDYWGLVDGGYLAENGTEASGIHYRYDSCSQTPYLYNPSTEVMVSFDNARSFAAKGQYIKSAGMRGFAMWEMAGDYKDVLLDSISSAMGCKG